MSQASGGLRSAEVLLPLTFLGAILAGAALLWLPGMTRGGVSPLDLLFTATSAVCVTGLTVVDTGATFTPRGQATILGLIQAGGLGIMTFSYLLLVVAGKRVALQGSAALKESFTPVAGWRIGRLLAVIVGTTLVIEAAGFLALWRATDDAWTSAFHSVSAFCNAGFSLHAASLQGQPTAVVLPILLLIVAGGLGFTVLSELGARLVPRRGPRPRFSLHTRIVLTTSLAFWIGGALLLWITEAGKAGHALFMSASARTAGFETLPVGALTGGSILVLIFLMFVGASPGSTGGGIKTTTFAVASALVVAALRGRERATIGRREIPRELLRRMFAVITFALLIAFFSTFLLDLFEGGEIEDLPSLAFEATSALGTVGLSTGVTPHLTNASKILLCVVMFLGRVGSLSLLTLLVRDRGPFHVRYPEERVMIG
ncbi:MAG: TrkH family potassium uptake protein [Planctomycetaceae bacterium]